MKHIGTKTLLIFSISIISCILFTACNPSFTEGEDGKEGGGSTIDVDINITPDEETTENIEFTDSKAATITLKNGESSTSSPDSVNIDNLNNIVTITQPGLYLVTGSLVEGNLIIDALRTEEDDTVELELNGVYISSSTAAPIYSLEKTDGTYKDCKLKIKRVADSSSVIRDNRLTSLADTYEGDDNAAIFANSDLKIAGKGKLSVYSSFNNGIATDDELEIKNGTLVLSDIQNNALKAHDNITFGEDDGSNGPIVSLSSLNGNGVRVDETDSTGIFLYDGEIEVVSKYDALDSESNILISGGNLEIISGGGSTVQTGNQKTSIADSSKGIKATTDVTITGGSFAISSHDDAIHANGNITISDGNFNLMSDDDGIHADVDLTISGGIINLTQSYEGFEAETINLTGGTTSVKSRDDGYNAAGGSDGSGWGYSSSSTGLLNITGGNHYVNANGDGLDSNGNILMTGGVVLVEGPTNSGNGPIDYGDNNNYFSQSGGVIFAIGSSGMAQGATQGSQYSVLTKGSVKSGGTYIITDANNSPLYSFTISQVSECVYFSAPDLNNGSYYVYDGTIKNGEEIYLGLTKGGNLENGTKLASWSWSTSSIHINTVGGGGNPHH